MARVDCSCGGQNERCFKCDGRGWYDDRDDQDPLKAVPYSRPSYNVSPPSKTLAKSAVKRRRLRTGENAAIQSAAPKAPASSQQHPIAPRAQRTGQTDRGPRQLKPNERSLYTNSDGDHILCTYPSHLKAGQVQRIASQTLARVRRSVPRRWKCTFRSQYQVRCIHLRENGSVLVILKDLFNGQTVRALVEHDDVSIKREVGQLVQAKMDAEGRTAPREVQVVERGLDASRDYWRIRDGGQFGSHPTHDDYDN